jgi:hypothetical protein
MNEPLIELVLGRNRHDEDRIEPIKTFNSPFVEGPGATNGDSPFVKRWVMTPISERERAVC